MNWDRISGNWKQLKGSLKQRCHGCARVTRRLEHSARKKERLRALTGLVPTPRAECEALIDAPVQRIRVRKAARRYGLGKEAHDIRVRWLDSYRQKPKREALAVGARRDIPVHQPIVKLAGSKQ